jgi:phage terminase large subunit-like protein
MRVEGDTKLLLAAAIRRKKALDRVSALDGVNPASRPTPKQQELLDDLGVVPVRYVRAANQSGKTQTIVRECAWVFQENHPNWKRSPAWGDEKLQMLIVCQTLKQFEEIIWKKLEPLLDPGCYHVKRGSQGIDKIINTVNGNEIVVLSFHNTGDCFTKMQGFVAHWAWIDEMPHDAGIIEELIRRVASRSGSFVATFTPKVRNDKIRAMVDGATAPFAKVYVFKMFDNP